MNKLFSFIICLFCLTGCQKTELGYTGTVQFYLDSPKPLQTFGKGDTINIVCMIVHDKAMYGYRTKISDAKRHTIYYENKVVSYNDTLYVNEQWVNGFSSSNDMRLDVVAIIDESGEEEAKSIAIRTEL